MRVRLQARGSPRVRRQASVGVESPGGDDKGSADLRRVELRADSVEQCISGRGLAEERVRSRVRNC
jgi:hypothetical protein